MTLDFLFNPKSIAIVGVSADPNKLGSVVLTNLKSAGYQGNIYPVNPKYEEIYGLKCYPKISDIQDTVDLICIVIPNTKVNEVLEDAGEKGVKGAVIISAGFGENGEEGMVLEKEVLNTARKYGIRIMGPNCLGEIIPKNKINLSFAASNAKEGDIAFLTQSGAFLTALLDMSLEKDLGFSHLISIGNKSDLKENDFIQNWLEDPAVKVIGAYLEDVSSGHELVELYKNAQTKKPFVIFKPGESEESQKAISSHTGSLAGSFETFNTAMKQAGIIVAKDINDMFNYLYGFSWAKLPEGNRVAIVTNAGGPGVIATDYLFKNSLQLAEISEESKKELTPKLPFNASVNNPIDLIGDASAQRYKDSLDAIITQDNIDAIIVLLTPQIVTEIEDTAKVIINASKISNKPIIPVFLGGKYVSFGLQKFYDEKIPAFKDISEAIETLSKLYQYNEFIKNSHINLQKRVSLIDEYKGLGVHRSEVSNYLASEQNALSEDLVMKLASEVAIELPRQKVVSSFEEALEFAKENYPVVLKATTDVIAHKTDLKALYLNINDENNLRECFSELAEMLKNNFNIDSPQLLIQEQIKAQEEIFIGANRDGNSNVYENDTPGFGHLLAFGKGGIYTEVYKDLGFSLVPSTREEILAGLQTTKVYEIIQGARGKENLALEKLVELIDKVQKLVLLYPEIESLDINPVLLTTDRAVTVDLKIFVKN